MERLRKLEAFMLTGTFTWVRLSKPIMVFEDRSQRIMDVDKLSKHLAKENEKDSSAIGIIESKLARIVLYDNNKFKGIVWAGRTKLSGTWE